MPHLKGESRIAKVARSGGVSVIAMKKWMQTKGKKAGNFVWEWYNLVDNMT